MIKFDKKFIISCLLIIIFFAIIYFDCKFILKKLIKENKFTNELVQIAEANKEPVFKLSKMIKYSSAEATDNSAEQNLQDISISQYSDIAIYIQNCGNELTEKNTIKELYIDNFNINVKYDKGTPTLYYKNPLSISKYRKIDENEIQDSLKYNIIYTNEENANSNYDLPVFFTDCSNPITIGYINKDIINNYKVTKENGLIAFDGRIFENLNVDLEELSPKISFTIHIKNNLDENYICNASADLKLETEKGSVKSGYIIEIMDNINYYKFFKEVKI